MWWIYDKDEMAIKCDYQASKTNVFLNSNLYSFLNISAPDMFITVNFTACWH